MNLSPIEAPSSWKLNTNNIISINIDIATPTYKHIPDKLTPFRIINHINNKDTMYPMYNPTFIMTN
jgi:hypothetical protein